MEILVNYNVRISSQIGKIRSQNHFTNTQCGKLERKRAQSYQSGRNNKPFNHKTSILAISEIFPTILLHMFFHTFLQRQLNK